MRTFALLSIGFVALLLFQSVAAEAQSLPNLGDLLPSADAAASGRIIQFVVVLTVLSVAPGLALLGWIMSLQYGDILIPLLGVATLVFCVGTLAALFVMYGLRKFFVKPFVAWTMLNLALLWMAIR